MIVALEFYIRCLDLHNNLPIPCSFCLENGDGDRKVVTLNEAYRHPELVAVRHWLLSQCVSEQALPVLNEQLIPRDEVYCHDFVVVPQHSIMSFQAPFIPSSLNVNHKPMPADQFTNLYTNFLRTDVHLYYKETWIWREFLKTYMPFMASFIWDERDELGRLRDLMSLVMNSHPELWHKWLHWRKYMIDFQGLPGEIAFCREYGSKVFSFV